MRNLISFDGRKPSKAQVVKEVRKMMKKGWNTIEVLWGENWLEFTNVNGYWHGSGWIKDISGQDLANFDLNERKRA